MISTHVTVIELLWTLSGLVGLAVTSLNFRNALRDALALRRSGRNSTLLELASTAGKMETSRMLGHALVVTVGVIAMTLPNPGGAWPASTLGWVITMSLYVTVGIFVYQSLLLNRSRQRMKTYLGG